MGQNNTVIFQGEFTVSVIKIKNPPCVLGVGNAVGKEEFEKAGIPGIYYDILSQQMADTNREVNILDHYMKRIPPEEWEKQMEEAKKRYWEKERPALIKRLEKL